MSDPPDRHTALPQSCKLRHRTWIMLDTWATPDPSLGLGTMKPGDRSLAQTDALEMPSPGSRLRSSWPTTVAGTIANRRRRQHSCAYTDLDTEKIAATNIAHIAILCCPSLRRLKRPLITDMLCSLSLTSLWLTALVAVPAPEILSIWSGVFRPRDGHVGVGLAFCANFHLAAHRVNRFR
jgi:hypothetical protein